MAAIERALVVGGGIGGLGAATALAQRGIDVEIVEVKPDAEVYGVGINQPGNSLRALDALGVLDEVLAVGFQFDGWDFRDADGNLVVGIDTILGDERIPHNNGLARRQLHEILLGAADRAGVRISYGTTFTELRNAGDVAEVELSDGREGTYDLVAGFDGIRSPTREQLFGEGARSTYAGYVIWRVTIPRPPEVTRGAIYQSVGVKAGYIPLSQDSMYLFNVTPEPKAVRVQGDAAVEALRERLTDFGGIVGDIRDGLKPGDDVVYSPLHEVMLPLPWFSGRIVLGGDAVHACAPHLTQGAAMALEDGVVLADELDGAEDVEAALQRYGERRYPRAKLVQDASHGILEQEMSITAETLPFALQGMREHLPENMAGIEGVLAQPA
jgi:2-polyprenyl-6-methoxyphenol hydroxylase-like FAD-dependent oxidoreductase